ncbi:MAG TPA: Fic family protein [Acidimicrobiia bacterium]|nr:Fic family protein [Acidimicrobiia bacterium]
MPHQLVSVDWEGRPVDAFVPEPLAALGPIGAEALRDAARAEGVLTASAVRHDPRLEVAARLLLRAEGLASSRIEAIDAPAELVAVADVDRSVGGPAAWVADNLRAVDAALDHDGPLTRESLWEWHRILMASSDLDDLHKGAWRDRLGWVGGPTPQRAAHVATPHDRIDSLMRDLVDQANATTYDPVTAAALVHAQFETIHPFADGNGRIGRILIGWMLHRRPGMAVPPPISVAFLRDVGGYLSGLTLFRTAGPDEWVRWFARTVEHAATSSSATLAAVSDLVASWPARLGGIRSDAAAHRLVHEVATHPALDVATAADLLGVSAPAARTALEALTEHGVLRLATLPGTRARGRPRRWWVAGELLDLLAR